MDRWPTCDGGPARAWISLGLGAGHSDVGGVAGRGAASFAVNRVLVLTLEGLAARDDVWSERTLIAAHVSDAPHTAIIDVA